jgi:hypothetical protein
MKTLKRYIICAAVQYKKKIVLGHNHGDILQNILKGNPDNPQYVDQAMQGFIDNHGQFLSRQDAARVAFEAGQIKEYKENQILLSEELDNRLWRLMEINLPGSK